MRAPLRLVASCLAVLATACASPSSPPASPPPAPTYQPLLAQIASATTASASVPAAPAPSAAPEAAALPAEVRELQRAILASHGASDAVQSLTSEVGPRLAGSQGDRLAVAWALAEMKRRGLSNVHAEKVMVRHWERGAESAAIVAPVRQPLVVVALGWSGATPARGVEAEVVRFESLEALKKADAAQVAKKIVFIDARMRRTADGRGYGEAVNGRGDGPAEAAKKGAVALVIRSIGTDHSRFPHTGATRQKDAKTALPAGAISNADADLLAHVIEARGAVKMALTLTPKWLPDAESANVVGEVPGRETPDEAVILGAHLDSWDLATGAIDDGAGCGIVLEATRALAALPKKPRRTVRVVLFAAEENSLAGGKEYARAHAAEVAKIVVALEADSGTDRATLLRATGGPEAAATIAAIAPAVAPLGIVADGVGAFGGADVSPLRELGVPLVDLQQDFSRYFDTHHTANDTFAEVDAEALAQVSAAFATVAWAAAEAPAGFGRVPEAKREREGR